MCKHGTHKNVTVVNPNQNKKTILVDACIADEIQCLNDQGVITLGCCCGHGLAGQVTEWENGFGKWKGHHEPPHALIDKESIKLVKELGYTPYPYFYADGNSYDVWQMHLKTGCVTESDITHYEDNM
jgi:hypothetical protein